MLNNEHINFIIKDLHQRGIILEDFQDEVIDHVCTAVEDKMSEGLRFADAYHDVVQSFGNTPGLQKIQSDTLRTDTKPKIYMIRNYIKTALRQMAKGRLYTAINIIGLAIGIASTLLIVLYLQNETSYDSWNEKAGRIVRVHTEIKFGPNHVKLANGPAPVGNALQTEYPEVEASVRFLSLQSYLVRRAEESVNSREANVIWTDSTFFKVFPVRVIEGNPAKALTEARSLAISESIARKYFPDGNALGQLLTLDNVKTGKVTAVFEDLPDNTHFHYNILISMVGDWPVARTALSQDFLTGDFSTYLLLKEGTDARVLESKLPGFVQKYMGKAMGLALGMEFSLEQFQKAGNIYEITLMPLRDIHLHSNLVGEAEPNGNITYVYMFGTIALLILIIACVNFMNLSTARSGDRAKEVGIRKVMGSLRSHLVRQFLTESIIISLMAFVLAVAISWIMIPLFNDLASKQLSIPFDSTLFVSVAFGGAIAIGIIAGIYPAFFLSAFRPLSIIKGSTGTGKSFIRNGLVVFQFAISIFLIIGTITVNRQLSFIQNKEMGFDRSQVIVVKDGYALRPNPGAFKTEALKISAIESGTMTSSTPIDNPDASRNMNATWKEGSQPSADNMVNLQSWGVDQDYIKTFGMKVIEGRGFSRDFPADDQNIVINQTAAKILNFEGGPIGKKLHSFAGSDVNVEDIRTYTIIGVVEDFHFSSIRESILPVGLVLGGNDNAFSFRFSGNNAKEVVDALQATWNTLAPGQPFRYTFLDEEFGRMYAAEQRLGNIFEVFSTLAIIIACIGLFALTAFTAQQRTKEIGIRKVLGASVPGIVILLSKEFGKLIAIAFVFAVPIAWYTVEWWLTSYTYKTEIGAGVYLTAGLMISGIALITMSFQSIKAAVANPVKSLRSE
jgi:putative ABC transport system permease protein